MKHRPFATIRIGLPTLLALAVFLSATPVYAADPVLTVTQKQAYDKTVAGADSAAAAKLKEQYQVYESLLKSSRDLDQKTSALHKQNSAKEAALRKQIGQIDAAKLDKLKQAYEQAKSQYRKFKTLHQAANQQLSLAKKLKNRLLTSICQAQVDSLKLTMQWARQANLAKETAHATARKSAQEKMKRIRAILGGIDPLQAQIRDAKRTWKAPKDDRADAWKTFKQALAKRDAKSAANLLATVNSRTKQLIERQQRVYDLENQIAGLNRTAEAQLKLA